MKAILKTINNKKGNISVIMCVALIALLAITAYAVDIGQVYIEKQRLSNGIDAAALAAALELPADRNAAYAVAEEYLIENNVDPSEVEIIIAEDNRSIELIANRNVNHLFARVVGINASQVDATNKVIIAPLRAAKGGIRPFAVEDFSYEYGDQVVLKEGAGDGYHGNYGAVALGGSGTSTLRYNVINGYGGIVRIGDIINTEPGNMASINTTIKNVVEADPSSFEDFERGSPRIWVIPLVDSLIVSGREGVLVTGFGEFYVENVKNNAGKTEITGRFVRFVGNGEVDVTLEDKGAYGAKLVK